MDASAIARSRLGSPRRQHLRRSAQVGVGLLAVGVGSALVLALAARELDAPGFAVLATWMTLANLVGLAFSAVEMYLPLPVLRSREQGEPDGPLVATFTRAVGLGALLLSALLLGMSGWLVPDLLGGEPVLLVLLMAYALLMAAQAQQRGVAVGRTAFQVVGWQMGADGLVRTTGATLLGTVAAGSASPRAFALTTTSAAAVGVLSGWRAGPGWAVLAGPRAPVPWTPVALLAVASIGPLVVNNAGVPWLSGTDRVAPETIGAVAGALTLSRIPTLFAGVAYGPLLAPLASAVTDRDAAAFAAVLRRATAGVAGMLGTFVLGFALLGPHLLELYLGPAFRLSSLELAGMAASSAVMFACVVEQAALAALSAWNRVAVAWAAGLGGFILVLAVPGDATSRVVLAVLLGPSTAYLVMAVARRREQARRLPRRTLRPPG